MNKKLLVATMLVAVVALGVAMFKSGKTVEIRTVREVGGATNTGIAYNGGENLTRFTEVGDDTAAYKWIGLSIGSATSTACIQNTEPFTRFIDLATITTTGTATATPYRGYIATSSSPALLTTTGTGAGNKLPLYGALTWSGIINGFKIASSSLATTTSQFDQYGGYALTGSKITPWKTGEYICTVLQVDAGSAAVSAGCSTRTGGAMCESATSTARGFDVDALFRTYATSTYR